MPGVFGEGFLREFFMEFEGARKHPRWNEDRLRLILPVEEIERLNVKFLSQIELRKVLSDIAFNPWQVAYPDAQFIFQGEVGHDLDYRYVVLRS